MPLDKQGIPFGTLIFLSAGNRSNLSPSILLRKRRDTTALSNGTNVLRVTAYDGDNPAKTGSHEIQVTVDNGPPALAITSVPLNQTAGSQGTMTVESQDTFGSVINVTANTTVSLATDSGGGEFRTVGTSTVITGVVIAAGTSSAAFDYRDTAAGSPTVTVSAPGSTLDTQVQTIANVPPPPPGGGSDGGGGGGDSGSGCGLMGLEPLLMIGLLALNRRRLKRC